MVNLLSILPLIAFFKESVSNSAQTGNVLANPLPQTEGQYANPSNPIYLTKRSVGIAVPDDPINNSEAAALNNPRRTRFIHESADSDYSDSDESDNSLSNADVALQSVCDDPGPAACDNLVSNPSSSDSKSETLLCQMLMMSKQKEKLLCELLKHNKGSKKKRYGITDEEVAERYLPEEYDKLHIPVVNSTIVAHNGKINYGFQPLQAQLCLRIRGVRAVDEINESVTLDMDVFVMWVDGAIKDNAQRRGIKGPVFVNPEFMKKVWIPDIYFEELTSMSRPTFMGESLTVYLNPYVGEFIYRSRIIAAFSCPMDFHYYPGDTQECNITIKSFTFDVNKLRLNWWAKTESGVYLFETSDSNFEFQVTLYPEEDLVEAVDSITYSTLTFSLKSHRKMNYHLVQTYLPSIFFVLVTWLCFLIPSQRFDAQILISMSTLLTLTAMFASVRQSTPIVSYVKAIDWWMVACIIFIFLALAAFCTAAWSQHIMSLPENQEIQEMLKEEDRNRDGKVIKGKKSSRRKYAMTNYFMEKYPRILLPLGFIVFNVFYWIWLPEASGYFQWHIDSKYNAV